LDKISTKKPSQISTEYYDIETISELTRWIGLSKLGRMSAVTPASTNELPSTPQSVTRLSQKLITINAPS
jgi:hypothetical protein